MKIYKALLKLEKFAPELFYLMRRTKIEVSDKTETACATIEKGDDKQLRFKILINEKWHEELDDYSLAALIEHELLHIVLNHLTRDDMRAIAKKDNATLNTAMDAVINDLGDLVSKRDKLHPILQDGVFMEDLRAQLNKSDLSVKTHSSLDIYSLIAQAKDEGPIGPDGEKQLPSDFPSSFDEGLTESDQGSEGIESDQATAQELESIFDESDIAKQIETIVEKKAGKSSDCRRIFDKMIEKKKSEAFKKAVNQFLASTKSAEKVGSWKRFSRRFPGQKGKMRENKQKILLGLDMSGSMCDEATIKKMQEVCSAAIAYEFEVDLIFGDTRELGFFESIKPSFDWRQIKGGGGTELGFIFRKFPERYDGTIVVTDGEFDHSDIPPRRKFLFMLTYPNGALSRKHKTINLF